MKNKTNIKHNDFGKYDIDLTIRKYNITKEKC